MKFTLSNASVCRFSISTLLLLYLSVLFASQFWCRHHAVRLSVNSFLFPYLPLSFSSLNLKALVMNHHLSVYIERRKKDQVSLLVLCKKCWVIGRFARPFVLRSWRHTVIVFPPSSLLKPKKDELTKVSLKKR